MNEKELFDFIINEGQGHILKHVDSLEPKTRDKFLDQLRSIDFKHLSKALHSVDLNSSKNSVLHAVSPIPESKIGDINDSPVVVSRWWNLGLEAISLGKTAVILLAGGQGSRLGVSYPKGMYDVGLPSKKTLFQIQTERLIKVMSLAKAAYGDCQPITWFIMTSESTSTETIRFFKKHDFFGFPEKDIFIFEQNQIPCVTLEGKIMMTHKDRIAVSPNGNGGLYDILEAQDVLNVMEKRKISYVQIYCVDNILIRMADPYFFGYCIENQLECAAKVVEKKDPNENLGVVCYHDNTYKVIEYSEMTLEDKSMRQKNSDRLLFNTGNICIHFMTFETLAKVSAFYSEELPYHVALKKIPCIDDQGNKIFPEKPNGIKLEKFIFDVFPFFNNFGALRINREDEYAPLKNAEEAKTSCPSTSRHALTSYHKRLISSHTTFAHPESEALIEISPLTSYAGEGLESFDGKVLDNSSDLVL